MKKLFAQFQHFIGFVLGLVPAGIVDVQCDPSRLRAPGSVLHPRIFDRVVNERKLHGIAWRQCLDPGGAAPLELLRIFKGQETTFRTQAVLERIELHLRHRVGGASTTAFSGIQRSFLTSRC